MKWKEIRQQYPQSWLLLEALEAHTTAKHRIVEQFAVLNRFQDSASAMDLYTEMHHSSPERELYVLHTSKEALNIQERKWLGLRR